MQSWHSSTRNNRGDDARWSSWPSWPGGCADLHAGRHDSFVVAVFIVALVSPIQDFRSSAEASRVISVVVTLLFVLASFPSSRSSSPGDYDDRVDAGIQRELRGYDHRLLKPVEYLYERKEPPDRRRRTAPAGRAANRPRPRKDRWNSFLELRIPMACDPGYASAGRASAQEPNERSSPRRMRPIPTPWRPKGLESIRTDRHDLKNYIFNVVKNAFGTVLGFISGVLFVCSSPSSAGGRNPYSEHSQVYGSVADRRYVGIHFVISGSPAYVWHH